MHKFDRLKFEQRQQDKTDLNQPYTPPHSVPALRERVARLEQVVGIIEKPEE